MFKNFWNSFLGREPIKPQIIRFNKEHSVRERAINILRSAGVEEGFNWEEVVDRASMAIAAYAKLDEVILPPLNVQTPQKTTVTKPTVQEKPAAEKKTAEKKTVKNKTTQAKKQPKVETKPATSTEASTKIVKLPSTKKPKESRKAKPAAESPADKKPS